MKKIINLLFVFLLIQMVACQNKKQEAMKSSSINLEKDYTMDETKPKTGYFLQINNQNCHYKILVNDFLNTAYTDAFPAYSFRSNLNYEINKSGEQKLSILVYPINGDKLSRNADITIRLMRYADMGDKANDFGGATTILEWEMPQVEEKGDLPFYRFDTVFNAEVPYEITTIDYAEDLSKMDKEVLLKEVVEQFTTLHGYIKNDYDKFNDFAKENISTVRLATYETEEDLMAVLLDNKENFEKPENKKLLQPLENYRLVLYGNGRIATLERQKDGGRIIWGKDHEGDEKFSLPLFIYKDKRDNQWHIW